MNRLNIYYANWLLPAFISSHLNQSPAPHTNDRQPSKPFTHLFVLINLVLCMLSDDNYSAWIEHRIRKWPTNSDCIVFFTAFLHIQIDWNLIQCIFQLKFVRNGIGICLLSCYQNSFSTCSLFFHSHFLYWKCQHFFSFYHFIHQILFIWVALMSTTTFIRYEIPITHKIHPYSLLLTFTNNRRLFSIVIRCFSNFLPFLFPTNRL